MSKNRKEVKKVANKMTDMYIRDIEQTVYGKLFAEKTRVMVTTRSGIPKKGVISSIESNYLGGIWIGRELKEGKITKGTFIPFSAIDSIEVREW